MSFMMKTIVLTTRNTFVWELISNTISLPKLTDVEFLS